MCYFFGWEWNGFCLTTAEWAAWVQAIGVIGALGISIHLAKKQSIELEFRDARMEASKKRNAALIIKLACERIVGIYLPVSEKGPASLFDITYSVDLIEKFSDIILAYEEGLINFINPIEIGDIEITNFAVKIKYMIPSIRNNYKKLCVGLEIFPGSRMPFPDEKLEEFSSVINETILVARSILDKIKDSYPDIF